MWKKYKWAKHLSNWNRNAWFFWCARGTRHTWRKWIFSTAVWTKSVLVGLEDACLFRLQLVSFIRKNLWVSSRVSILSSIMDSSSTLTNSCLNLFERTSHIECYSKCASKGMFLCSIDLLNTWTVTCLSCFLNLSNKDDTLWWWFS